MRRSWLPLFSAALFSFLPSAAHAQTTMAKWGCNASPSCRQNGFSIVTGQDREHTGVLFGASWEHGFRLELLRHPNAPEEAPKMPEQRFHLHPPSEVTPPPVLPPTAPDVPGSSAARESGGPGS